MTKVAIILLTFALSASVARADDKPWAQGIPEEQRDRANALFEEGNEFFAQLAHAAALQKYQAAIALWDHPMIRFNMAVTLIRLERILEAADSLDAALRFGSTPFTPQLYQQALDFRTLISKSVALIDASCTQSATQVSFDGKPWFACPGSKTKRVLAGEHIVVGEKSGFMTQTRRLVLAGGSSTKVDVQLMPLDVALKLVYPSPRWAPWAVAGTGVAIGAGGLALWLAGKSQLNTFEREFARVCPDGCDYRTQPLLNDEYDSARLKGKIGIGLMVSGGVILGGGVTWLFLNRPRRLLPQIEVGPQGGSAGVSLAF